MRRTRGAKVYKSIVLDLQRLNDSLLYQSPQQPRLENTIQHLLWVLNYLPHCLPEQPFQQYEGSPSREEVQRLQQIVEIFLLQLLNHVSQPSTSQPPLYEHPNPGLVCVPGTPYQPVFEQTHPGLLYVPSLISISAKRFRNRDTQATVGRATASRSALCVKEEHI
jgi:hypothetical protein